MTEIPSPIFQWLHQHPNLSGLVTFLISTIESVAIIGTIIPGSIMMTGIGALAGAGIIPLYPTILWAILGAILGDGISYWAGRYFNTRLPQIWPFRGYPKLLKNGEQFFQRHGSMSVFMGRFVGPVRALVPLIAGMLGMQPLRFTIANIISAIGWAPAYMLPGILLGAASLELPPDIAVHAIIMLLMSGLMIVLCGWSLITLSRMISRQIDQFLTGFWQWLQRSRPLHPLTTLLRHHAPEKNHGQLILAFYILCALFLLGTLTLTVLLNGSDNLFVNQFFFHLFRTLRTPTVDRFMVVVSLTADARFVLPLILTLFAWLFWTKHPRTAQHVLLLGVLSVGAITLFKHLTHSERPWGILQVSPEFSFPSGHATLAAVFFFAIPLLLGHVLHLKKRAPLYWLAGSAVILVGMSRLYLGAHWFTDVLGGWLLGAIILMVTILSWHRQAETPMAPRGILMTLLVTLLLSGAYTYHRDFANEQRNHTQAAWPTQTASLNTWWMQHDKKLPLYRINRFGLARQILNLQWAGNLDHIRNALLANGWQEPPTVTWVDILHRLSNIQSTEHLPLVAPVYLGKEPVLVMIKRATKKPVLVVLRLWTSDLKLTDSHVPLWVGTIEEVLPTYSWLQFRKWQTTLPLASLLFVEPTNAWTLKTISKQLDRQYRPRDRALILLRPAT